MMCSVFPREPINVFADAEATERNSGECCLHLSFPSGDALMIHHQTAESLERLGQAILDCCQEQRDRDGRRALATGTMANGEPPPF